MGDAFIFLETDLVWFVVAAGLLLVGLFLLKEWSRRHRRGFPIRLLAAALAITSLVCLALRPATLRSLDSKSAVILTRGYSEIRLDSLREVHPGIQQIEYHRGRLMALEPVISEVFLLGDGLLPYDFWQLEKERVHFLPPDEMQEGISSIQAIGPIVLGESFSVSGRFERPGTGHRLLLRDPGGNPLDSLLLGNGTASLFRLEGTPKAPGPQTYSLEQWYLRCPSAF